MASEIQEIGSILGSIVSLIGGIAGLISLLLHIRPKSPKIEFIEMVKDNIIQYNKNENILEAWIPIGFQNDGNSNGVVYINEMILTKTIGTDFSQKFEILSYHFFDGEKKQTTSVLNVEKLSFGVLLLNVKLKVLIPKEEVIDEVYLTLDGFLGIKKTVPTGVVFIQRIFKRKLKLDDDSMDLIFKLTLPEYLYVEYLENKSKNMF